MQHAEHAEQNTLFPEVDSVIVYEQPLNERIRNCLRLEHLFLAVQEGLSGDGFWNARTALVSMIEISDLLSRSDTKGELIKELERQFGTLCSLRNNPGVYPTPEVKARLQPNLTKTADFTRLLNRAWTRFTTGQ